MRPLLMALALFIPGCGYDTGPLDPAPDAEPERPGSGNPLADGGGDLGVAACDNGIDDDCDGLIDFAGGDPGCASATDNSERGLGLVCDDGIDNDNDDLIDYVDPACGVGGDPGCSSPSDTSEVDTPSPF